jgi:hypothetical protein
MFIVLGRRDGAEFAYIDAKPFLFCRPQLRYARRRRSRAKYVRVSAANLTAGGGALAPTLQSCWTSYRNKIFRGIGRKHDAGSHRMANFAQ